MRYVRDVLSSLHFAYRSFLHSLSIRSAIRDMDRISRKAASDLESFRK